MQFKTIIITGILFLLNILFSACFPTVMQTHESAKMVKKNEIEASANYSFYKNLSSADPSYIKNHNLGVRTTYGISEKHNIGLRYQYISDKNAPYYDGMNYSGINYEDFIEFQIEFHETNHIHFIEINHKISLKKDKIAFSTPIALHRATNNTSIKTLVELKPRFYFTFANKKNTIDMSIVPQGRFGLIGGVPLAGIPSLSLGMGFSSDLDKWAIRPEISYDYWTIAVGVSGNYRFPLRKK